MQLLSDNNLRYANELRVKLPFQSRRDAVVQGEEFASVISENAR